MRLILASQSPRRRELLALMGLTFDIVVSEVEETVPENIGPGELVEQLALHKAHAVRELHPEACVVGADTIVYIGGEIMGKPRDDADAARILNRLQGRTHTVYTGVAVLTPGGTDIRHDATRVTFAPMSEKEIAWYVATGEPRDKAGAYGIQGPGGMFVERVEGNYFTVIGMPLPLLYRMLQKAGVIVL
jgi:septum formation protein